MTQQEKIEYWRKRVTYYSRKYGKNSIEVKSARLNLEIAIRKPQIAANWNALGIAYE